MWEVLKRVLNSVKQVLNSVSRVQNSVKQVHNSVSRVHNSVKQVLNSVKQPQNQVQTAKQCQQCQNSAKQCQYGVCSTTPRFSYTEVKTGVAGYEHGSGTVCRRGGCTRVGGIRVGIPVGNTGEYYPATLHRARTVPYQRSGPRKPQGLEWVGMGLGRVSWGRSGGTAPGTTLRARSVPAGLPCPRTLRMPSLANKGEN